MTTCKPNVSLAVGTKGLAMLNLKLYHKEDFGPSTFKCVKCCNG